MSNEMITSLPTVTAALPSDIIYAVQGGVSVQETLSQVSPLFLDNTILNNPGNPNHLVAGVKYQLLWDTVDNILWVCTTSGNALTAVWQPVTGTLLNGQILIGSTGLAPVAGNIIAGPGISVSAGAGSITISGTASAMGWTEVTGTTQAMTADNGYVANNAGLVTLILPAIAAFGTEINIIGKGTGGWKIAQNATQNINIGSVSSTAGLTGSVSSTNALDAVDLICTAANLTWTTKSAPQGILSLI